MLKARVIVKPRAGENTQESKTGGKRQSQKEAEKQLGKTMDGMFGNNWKKEMRTKQMRGKTWYRVKFSTMAHYDRFNRHKTREKNVKDTLIDYKEKGFNTSIKHTNSKVEGWIAMTSLKQKTVKKKEDIKGLINSMKIDEKQSKNSQVDYLINNFDKLVEYFRNKGLYEIKPILEDVLVKLKMKEMSNGYGFVILSGIGGSGKSKIAEGILDFLKTNLKSDFAYISTDDSTTTENLLCRVGLENGSETKRIGIMGKAINNKSNIFFDEFNRTEFRNIQKLMSLFAGGVCDSEGVYFKIPENMLIIGTCNLGSIGTYPIAEEFKQRCGIVELKYPREAYENILKTIFSGNPLNKMALDFYDESLVCAVENKHGWRNELSVRSLIDFINEVRSAIYLRGYNKKELQDNIEKAVKNIVLQFINENNPYDLKESDVTVKEISKKLYDSVFGNHMLEEPKSVGGAADEE